MLYISMSRTRTISSCSASKTVVSTSSGRCRRPANCSAYILATRAGVSISPSRSGSSPTASSISRTARSIRSWSTGGRSAGGPGVSSSTADRSLIVASSVVDIARRRAPVEPEAERLPVGRQRAVTAEPGTRTRGECELLRRQDRRTVGRQPLAVAGVGAAGRALLHGGEDLEDLLAGQGFLVEPPQHQVVQDVAALHEHFPRLVVRGLDHPLDLLVDRRRDLLGVVPAVPHFPAEERLAVAAAELPGAEPLAHAILGHHAAGNLGGLVDVVGGTAGRLVEDQLLGRAAAKQHGQLVLHLRASGEELVL